MGPFRRIFRKRERDQALGQRAARFNNACTRREQVNTMPAKRLKPRLESGVDCLMCAEFAGPCLRENESGPLTDSPGHSWRDTWTALSGPLSLSCRHRGNVLRAAQGPDPARAPEIYAQRVPTRDPNPEMRNPDTQNPEIRNPEPEVRST